MRSLSRLVFSAVSAVVAIFGASQAQASDFYMVMFGYQGDPNAARSSHTFATFVQVDSQQITQEVTVSWLPAAGYFGPGDTMPVIGTVPGHDYTLDETVALSGGKQIKYWGPYQITDGLFAKAVDRVDFLNSGTTSYKMFVAEYAKRAPALDNQPGGTINCIMAVSDLGGYLDTGREWGYEATQQTMGWLSRYAYAYPGGSHAEVAQLMHLAERLNQYGY